MDFNVRVCLRGEGSGLNIRKNMSLADHLRKGVLAFCVAAVVCICFWCTVERLRPIAEKYGAQWLFRISGVEAVRKPEGESYLELTVPQVHAFPETGIEQDEVWDVGLKPEPIAAATPDPSREIGSVEILEMSAGQPVDCFTVKDETGTGLDLEQELLTDPEISIKRDGSPVVLLYSTHTTESYVLESGADWYYLDDDFRSLNLEESVVSVAAEAAKVIESGGFGVVHDKTVHDHPAYSGSYARSMETIRKNLKEYPTIGITVDVHRDAFGESGATRYKPVAEINGRQAAQIMILTGCDLSENPVFPNWRENLHLALRMQQKGEMLFPGLFRPLYFCRRNYNMHVTTGSLLVEVGTDVNTLMEAQYAGRLLGETILAVLNDLADQTE